MTHRNGLTALGGVGGCVTAAMPAEPLCVCLEQETVSGGTTSVVLRGLSSDTLYDVAVVPVYPDVEGVRQAETGKTSE